MAGFLISADLLNGAIKELGRTGLSTFIFPFLCGKFLLYQEAGMTLEEAMGSRGLNSANREHCARYAGILINEDIQGSDLPEELQGIEISNNKTCEWFKKKAFINRYKHGVTFGSISVFFGDPSNPRFQVLHEEADPNSTELEFAHYIDSRDRLLLKMDKYHYVVVQVDKGLTKSGLIHLVSARYANRSEVDEALREYNLNGSVARFKGIFSSVESDEYDYFESLSKYDGDYTRLKSVFEWFHSGDSPDDTIARLMFLGFSVDVAESIVHDWMYDRNVESLLKLTKMTFGSSAR